ncbi:MULTISPECIES: hypothetical protein [unclassified Bradyrhizobium]|uniref:hypothetical protein n=1 Tax=unclassified Bradyrhizobium TaxID=2631580 RepID=UPI001160E780|nr:MULTISPECIES: hypothetical protein [unclassified Bradyrhizobium]
MNSWFADSAITGRTLAIAISPTGLVESTLLTSLDNDSALWSFRGTRRHIRSEGDARFRTNRGRATTSGKAEHQFRDAPCTPMIAALVQTGLLMSHDLGNQAL